MIDGLSIFKNHGNALGMAGWPFGGHGIRNQPVPLLLFRLVSLSTLTSTVSLVENDRPIIYLHSISIISAIAPSRLHIGSFRGDGANAR